MVMKFEEATKNENLKNFVNNNSYNDDRSNSLRDNKTLKTTIIEGKRYYEAEKIQEIIYQLKKKLLQNMCSCSEYTRCYNCDLIKGIFKNNCEVLK